MTESVPATTRAGGIRSAREAVRIRFVDNTPAGATVRRAFRQPRTCVAIEESITLTDLGPAKSWPEPTEQLDVQLLNAGAKSSESWLFPPNHPDAPLAVVVACAGATIRWRPGQAIVEVAAESRAEVLDGLVHFAFLEGELRRLEHVLEGREADAPADVALAYRINQRDHAHWQRLGETIEALYQMRLTYARLEPRLAHSSRTLSRPARRVMARLLHHADVEARLESFSDRLEACEDLYEGATDRVADYRWYRGGHRLEMGILFLLFIEVLLLIADIGMHAYLYSLE